MKKNNGFSLIEILVVLTIFSIVAVLSFRAIFLTLRGARKSDATVKVRDTLDYTIGTIERHLRNADSIVSCGLTTDKITYLDSLGNTNVFFCSGTGTDMFVASGSASRPIRLTNQNVAINPCSFVCETSTTGPSSITINLTGTDINTTGAEGAKVTISTKIYLRNY
jgi:prepilin-type N-terminal cleavage/methylation domain-containing protein